jgi:ferredoxin
MMMNIADIYEKFYKIGCLTFATIDKDYPQTRIAHLFAYDDGGLYFRTMVVKPFYNQLKKTEKVSVCGMFPKTSVSHDAQGMPYFPPGYAIRASGDVREISLETLEEKAAVSDMFMLGVKDIERYPAMTTFCLYRACGECMENCSFKAICQEGDRYVIDHARCDACGDCYTICPSDAVEIVIDPL